MVRLHERHEVRVVAIVVLHEHALVLQPDDGYPIAVVIREGADAEAKRRARAQLLAGRGCSAPIKCVDRP